MIPNISLLCLFLSGITFRLLWYCKSYLGTIQLPPTLSAWWRRWWGPCCRSGFVCSLSSTTNTPKHLSGCAVKLQRSLSLSEASRRVHKFWSTTIFRVMKCCWKKYRMSVQEVFWQNTMAFGSDFAVWNLVVHNEMYLPLISLKMPSLHGSSQEAQKCWY